MNWIKDFIPTMKKNISEKILINECLDTVSVEKPLENLKMKREFEGGMIYDETNYKLVEYETLGKYWVKDGSYKQYIISGHYLNIADSFLENIKFNQVVSSGNYLNDKKVGEWINYDRDGNVVKIVTYDNNGKPIGQ